MENENPSSTPPPVPPADLPSQSVEPPPVPPPAPPPAPTGTSSDEKNLAMFCHLAALAGLLIPAGNIIGPLILWLLKRESMPLVDAHGKEVLNFQITVTIALAVCIVTAWLLLPVLAAIIIGIAALVLTIIGTIKASNGELYRYPFTLRLVK